MAQEGPGPIFGRCIGAHEGLDMEAIRFLEVAARTQQRGAILRGAKGDTACDPRPGFFLFFSCVFENQSPTAAAITGARRWFGGRGARRQPVTIETEVFRRNG